MPRDVNLVDLEKQLLGKNFVGTRRVHPNRVSLLILAFGRVVVQVSVCVRVIGPVAHPHADRRPWTGEVQGP